MEGGVESRDDARVLEELLLCRAYLYRMFANLLGGEPNETSCRVLLGEDTIDVVRAFEGENATLEGFARFLLQVDVDSAFVDKTRDEFTRVLIGPAALPAQPM